MNFEKQERFAPLKGSTEILKVKTAAVIGLGGLGSHSAEYLTRMGIGTLILVDGDIVEESNLPRQGLYSMSDSIEKRKKVAAVKKTLKSINPEVTIVAYDNMLTINNVAEYLKEADIVLDGTDNLATRYIINDYCFQFNKPWVYASATTSIGSVASYIPGKTPCFRCLYDELPDDNVTCDINGVILPILTSITSIQVTETIKTLLGHPTLKGEYRYDIWKNKNYFFETSTLIDPKCSCQTGEWPTHSDKSIKMYLICSGDTTQANTDLPLSAIKRKMLKSGLQLIKENQDIVIFQTPEEKRMVTGYRSGKMIFHNFDKKEITEMINS